MNAGSDVVLITGATGQQGGAVARELLTCGHRVKAMTRKPESAAAQAIGQLGAEVVQGDFDDSESLKRAFDGAWGVFAMQNTWEAGVQREEEQGKRVAQVAKDAQVHHFVYTSVASAHRETGIPHFDNKWRVEETVRELGFPSHVVIRPAFFMNNFLSPWFKPGIDDGKLYMALAPDTAVQMISVSDIGKYGCRAFEQHEALNGQAIDIAGDEVTMPEAAHILSDAIGHPVEFVPVPIEDVRKMSDDYAIMLEWFDAVGYDVDILGIAGTHGIQPLTLADWAAQANWN